MIRTRLITLIFVPPHILLCNNTSNFILLTKCNFQKQALRQYVVTKNSAALVGLNPWIASASLSSLLPKSEYYSLPTIITNSPLLLHARTCSPRRGYLTPSSTSARPALPLSRSPIASTPEDLMPCSLCPALSLILARRSRSLSRAVWARTRKSRRWELGGV